MRRLRAGFGSTHLALGLWLLGLILPLEHAAQRPHHWCAVHERWSEAAMTVPDSRDAGLARPVDRLEEHCDQQPTSRAARSDAQPPVRRLQPRSTTPTPAGTAAHATVARWRLAPKHSPPTPIAG